jgi:hypothetical protein
MENYLLALFLSLSVTDSCDVDKSKLNNETIILIQKIQKLEDCGEPVSPFLDKVYSNMKYRANRLKVCVGLVKDGNNGFDCSRELRKMRRSRIENECMGEFEMVEINFKEFEKKTQELKSCKEVVKEFGN